VVIAPADRLKAMRALGALAEGETKGDIDYGKLSTDDWAAYHRLWAAMRDEMLGRLKAHSDRCRGLTAHDVTEALRIALEGN